MKKRRPPIRRRCPAATDDRGPGQSWAVAGAYRGHDAPLSILQPLASDPSADGRVRQRPCGRTDARGRRNPGPAKILSGELPQDKVSAALTGYAAMEFSPNEIQATGQARCESSSQWSASVLMSLLLLAMETGWQLVIDFSAGCRR